MFRFDGKTALVTGASRGIGRAVASSLASQGARIVAAARSEDQLSALCAEITDAGGQACSLALDLSRPEEVPDRIKALDDDFKDVDVLVNNAGVTDDNLLARMSLEQFEGVVRTNLVGTYALTKALVRGMMKRRYGRIVSVSSVVAMMGNPGQVNYAASKAGLIGFSKSLARELGSRNITVNVVAPGYVETAMTADLGDEVRSRLADGIVLGRLGEPSDIASAVLFLASDEAGYVTGEVVNVSGGLYI